MLLRSKCYLHSYHNAFMLSLFVHCKILKTFSSYVKPARGYTIKLNCEVVLLKQKHSQLIEYSPPKSSRTLVQFLLVVGQYNFGNKVPLLQNVFHPIVHTGLISFVCGKHKSKFECIRSKRPSNCRDTQYSNKSYLITILGIGLGVLFMPKHSSKEVNCIAKRI